MKPAETAPAAWPLAHIACPLRARDRAGTIRELVGLVAAAPGVSHPAHLLAAIEVREAQAPTYLGGGVAMPHARTDAVDQMVVAVGLSREGLRWGSSRELARLVFLVGVPRDQASGYLEMVRRITQTVRRIDWIEQAIACNDAAALARLLSTSIHL